MFSEDYESENGTQDSQTPEGVSAEPKADKDTLTFTTRKFDPTSLRGLDDPTSLQRLISTLQTNHSLTAFRIVQPLPDAIGYFNHVLPQAVESLKDRPQLMVFSCEGRIQDQCHASLVYESAFSTWEKDNPAAPHWKAAALLPPKGVSDALKSLFTKRLMSFSILTLESTIAYERVIANNKPKISKTFLRVIGVLKTPHPSLTALTLNGYALDADGARIVAGFLEGNTSLLTLNLKNSGITDANCFFQVALGTNQTLTRLILSKNPIREGCQSIARALREHKALQILQLENSAVCDEGAIAFATTLLCNSDTLTHLDLSNNAITAVGAAPLARAALMHSGLQTLCLNGNRLGRLGAKAFAETIAHNTNLTDLGLADTGIDKEGAQALASALAQNTRLSRLNLRENNGELAATAFRDTLRGRRNLEEHHSVQRQCSLRGNITLTELDLSRDNPTLASDEIWNATGEVNTLIKLNKHLQERLQAVWSAASTLIAFHRANKQNALRNSIQPLVPMVLHYAEVKKIVTGPLPSKAKPVTATAAAASAATAAPRNKRIRNRS